MTTASKESLNEVSEKRETRKWRHVCVTGESALSALGFVVFCLVGWFWFLLFLLVVFVLFCFVS